MNGYGLTFDIDWAPDFTIQKAAELLIENSIKCTWFITHMSPYIETLFQHKELFDFGIHPNFFPGSSHGNSEKEVLNHICSIVPEAKIVRSHALFQSSRLLSLMIEEFGIEIDCSLLLNYTSGITPHQIYFKHNSNGILRIPYFWEDDFHMYTPQCEWNINSPLFHTRGVKLFNFHPVLTFLNSETMQSYETLKKNKNIYLYNKEEMNSFVNNNSSKGTGVFLKSLISYLIENKIETYTISDLKCEFYNQKRLKLESVE